jgi:urease accessory protein
VQKAANLSIEPRRAGCGALELSLVAGRTAVTRSVAASPLKLLAPRRRAAAAWVYVSTYGGGLVAGDEIDLDVRLGPSAVGVLCTQASTKVYRSPVRATCRQTLRASVADGGLLVLAPDPLTCFAQAQYEQSQVIRLEGSGSLVLVDWLTSGRRARGECWAFSRYRTRLEVYRNDELILADALLLDPADGPLDSPFRLGRFHCMAMVVLIGKQLAQAVGEQLRRIAAKPIEPGARLMDGASPVPHGMLMRVIGETTDSVARYLGSALAFLGEVLGETPWARKW